MPFSPEHRTSTEDGDNTSHTDTVVDVFERFKNYLDEKVESFSSGLVSRTVTETQKLSRVAEAEKLKFAGYKDQFIFNSELCGTLDEVSDLLAAKQTEKAEEKVPELSKNLKRRQKIIKLADKSEAGWLAVKEYQTEELASDSEDEKRIRKAQERALKKKKKKKKKKQNVSRKQDRDRNSSLGASRFRAINDDRMLFRGIVLALLFVFHRQVFALCLPLPYCSVFYASAYWRRKIIILRANAVRKTENVFSFLRKFSVSIPVFVLTHWC